MNIFDRIESFANRKKKGDENVNNPTVIKKIKEEGKEGQISSYNVNKMGRIARFEKVKENFIGEWDKLAKTGLNPDGTDSQKVQHMMLFMTMVPDAEGNGNHVDGMASVECSNQSLVEFLVDLAKGNDMIEEAIILAGTKLQMNINKNKK